MRLQDGLYISGNRGKKFYGDRSIIERMRKTKRLPLTQDQVKSRAGMQQKSIRSEKKK